MKNCPFCNAPMEDHAKFCTNCGQKVDAAMAQQQGYQQGRQAAAPQGGLNQKQAPNGYGGQQVGLNQQQAPNGYGGQPVNRQGMQAAAPQGGIKPAKKNNMLPFIIIGAVAMVAVLAIVIFVVTRFVFGGKNKAPGVYQTVAIEMMGFTINPNELGEGGMTITLEEDGGAILDSDGEILNGTWTLEGDQIDIKADFLDVSGTLKDGVLIIQDMFGDDSDWTFTKDGKPLKNVTYTALDDKAFLDAFMGGDGGMIDDEFIDESTEEFPPVSASETDDDVSDLWSSAPSFSGPFVSPTKEIKWPSEWYGWARLTDFEGQLAEAYGDEDIADVFARFSKPDGVGPLFEIYDNPKYDADGTGPMLFLCVMENPNVLEPNDDMGGILLGEDLTDDDLFDIQTSMYDGKINFTVRYEGKYGACNMEFFLREKGAPWNENMDMLPPGYDTYCK